jgi:hypothetical protein
VKALLNNLPLSSLGNKANLAQALLEACSIAEALYQGSSLSRGGVPDVISEIEFPRITSLQAVPCASIGASLSALS